MQRILKEQGLRSVQALGRGEITAPMPPPSQGLAGDDDEFEPDERDSEDRDDAKPLSHPETGATRGALVSTAGGIVMSPDAIRRLQGALSELVECQRLLHSIKPDHDQEADPS